MVGETRIVTATVLLAGMATVAAYAQYPQDCGIKIPDIGALARVGEELGIVHIEAIGDHEVDEGKFKRYPSEQTQTTWRITRVTDGYTIRMVAAGPRRNLWFLSYDPSAPERGVFLAERPEGGSTWSLRPPDGSEAKPIRARIPGGDWFLDYDRRSAQKYLNTVGIRTIVTTYKLKLTRDKGPGFVVSLAGK